ncbi:hypothetical protein [Streptomyces phytophilus]|uniref:hypothetical protein n=1 Tax=Streptomyces phytophilus TaxID=722715 RepID=UPI0015F04762|nr:hypothetical protein [Streptomyces phytophilus]
MTAPTCHHWIAAEHRHCRVVEGVRRFVIGDRCAVHSPSALAGRPEPTPGPGWPRDREAA